MSNCLCNKCGRYYYNVTVLPVHCICGSLVQHTTDEQREHPIQILAQQRLAICNTCNYNVDNICLKFKEIHPSRACFISIGVNIPKAKCPISKW